MENQLFKSSLIYEERAGYTAGYTPLLAWELGICAYNNFNVSLFDHNNAQLPPVYMNSIFQEESIETSLQEQQLADFFYYLFMFSSCFLYCKKGYYLAHTSRARLILQWLPHRTGIGNFISKFFLLK